MDTREDRKSGFTSPCVIARAWFHTLMVCLLGGAALGQDRIHVLTGDLAGDEFGESIAGVGDVNFDGIPDVVIGAPGLGNRGYVRAFSGTDWSIIWEVRGGNQADRLGQDVEGIADLNGDGVRDVLVTATPLVGDPPHGPGYALVVSGVDGSIIHRLIGRDPLDSFGWSIADAGDIDRDGVHDIAVGAAAVNFGSTGSGSIFVYSGCTGTLIRGIDGTLDGSRFGWSVEPAGDVNNDGHDDLYVGVSNDSAVLECAGSVVLLSGRWISQGAGPQVLRRWRGSVEDLEMGTAIALLGDVNGDEVPDAMIVAEENPMDSPSAWVVSGSDGSTVYMLNRVIKNVRAIGDLTGDGINDVLCYGKGQSSFLPPPSFGAAHIRSGADGTVIRRMYGEQESAALGTGFDSIGDVNQDGLDDWAIGVIRDNLGGNEGSVIIMSGRCGDTSPSVYCEAKVNSAGCSPGMFWSGTPSMGGADDFHAGARDVIGGAGAVIYWSYGQDFAPLLQGHVCIAVGARKLKSIVALGTTGDSGCGGVLEYHLTQQEMIGAGWFPGNVIYTQFWARDPGFTFPNNLSLTNGLRFLVCP